MHAKPFIRQICNPKTTTWVSINDKLNLSSLIRSLICQTADYTHDEHTIYFNVSIHAPFEQLNRLFFSLFICSTLMDPDSGLTFSLSNVKLWKFIIEVPHFDRSQISVTENFEGILPFLSIICSNEQREEVTVSNYPLTTGDDEELVARFLKAFRDGTIDRTLTQSFHKEQPVVFQKLQKLECYTPIYETIQQYAHDLPSNKIYHQCFVKFLYRRVQFFTSSYYCYNENIRNLGSTVMRQMIEEAKSLVQIDFTRENYRKVYLVYDPNFSLQLLHPDWNIVPSEIKELFGKEDPMNGKVFQNKDRFCVCLSWLLNVSYETYQNLGKEMKFITTESIAYKLFHVHERKLMRMPLIIEGVGKTFLLKFYSMLLYSKLENDPNLDIAPRIRERTSLWLLYDIINKILRKTPALFDTFLNRMKRVIYNNRNRLDSTTTMFNGNEIDDDDEELEENVVDIIDNVLLFQQIEMSLQNYDYEAEMLQKVWRTILMISQSYELNLVTFESSAQTLIQKLQEHVALQIMNMKLLQPSVNLLNLLYVSDSPSIETGIEIFNEFVCYSKTKSLFYRMLLHPDVTEEHLEEFMEPIIELANVLPQAELVVFFDEVNTSSCLGFFKEMFMDRSIQGKTLPDNIFFTAAINPYQHDEIENDLTVHRRQYLVHQLPQSLEHLKCRYGTLPNIQLEDYIKRKIAMFQIYSNNKSMPLEAYAQETLCDCIISAQEFCTKRLSENAVSQ
ncbi:unnamed protein product, partial [Didymodactylos carnosus]